MTAVATRLQTDNKTPSETAALSAEKLQAALTLLASVEAFKPDTRYLRELVMPDVLKHARANVEDCLAFFAISHDEKRAELVAARKADLASNELEVEEM